MTSQRTRFLQTLSCLLLLTLLSGCGLRSDDALIRHFEAERADFDRLAETVYPTIKQYHPGNKLYIPFPEFVDRVKTRPGYSRLMRRIGASNFVFWQIDSEHTGFFLTVDTAWFHYFSKGYAYLPVPPSDDLSFMVPDIDVVEVEALSDTHTYFRHLEGNWYLFFEVVQ